MEPQLLPKTYSGPETPSFASVLSGCGGLLRSAIDCPLHRAINTQEENFQVLPVGLGKVGYARRADLVVALLVEKIPSSMVAMLASAALERYLSPASPNLLPLRSRWMRLVQLPAMKEWMPLRVIRLSPFLRQEYTSRSSRCGGFSGSKSAPLPYLRCSRSLYGL